MEKKSLAESLAESYPFSPQELQQLIDEVKVRCGFDKNSKEAEYTYVVTENSHIGAAYAASHGIPLLSVLDETLTYSNSVYFNKDGVVNTEIASISGDTVKKDVGIVHMNVSGIDGGIVSHVPSDLEIAAAAMEYSIDPTEQDIFEQGAKWMRSFCNTLPVK